MKSPYEILGVAKDATPDDIKRAYRKLASQHHPDRGGDTQMFQEIQVAYDTLSDPQKRQQYDRPQNQRRWGFGPQGFGPQGFGAGEHDFQTIFDIFGARSQNASHAPQYARMSLWINLADVATGGTRPVSVGSAHGTSLIEIEIPLGINDGDTIQYPRLAPGGIDLMVTFRIHPDPRFRRQGQNLHMEYAVSIWDLVLGGTVTVHDIQNNELRLVIPPKTQPGTALRCRGRGLPNRGGQAGDLMVHLQARLPENIPDQLLEAIQKHRVN